MLPPPRQPAPTTPGGKRKKKDGQKGQTPRTPDPQRPSANSVPKQRTAIKDEDTFPGADIVVQPKFTNATVSCNDVWTELTKSVNPREVGVQPIRWARACDAQVRVTCATQGEAEALAAAVDRNSAVLTASVQRKSNPRIAFHGVPVGLPNEDLTKSIRERTGADFGYEYKYRHGPKE